MSEWISVKDELPEDGVVVDIFTPDYGRLADYFYCKDVNGTKGNNFFDPYKNGVSCVRDATHWMPIPEPPKEPL